jgi:hypothetical protein
VTVRSSGEIEIAAPVEAVLAVLKDTAAWPDWSGIHRSVVVVTAADDGAPRRVRATVSVAGIADEQVLDYTWTDDGCTWEMVSGGQASSQTGSYRLTPRGSTTHVAYDLEVQPKLPVPGFIVRQAQKKVVAAATKDLKQAVERRT